MADYGRTIREIEAVRIKALEQEPFWSLVLCKMEIVVCTGYKGRPIATAATDGKHLWVNPDFWSKLTIQERVSLILHEAAHVALGHHVRRQERDPQWWNVAGDHAINNILRKEGNHIPDSWLCDPQFAGMAEERIYHEIFPGESGTLPPPPPDEPSDDGVHGDGPVVWVPKGESDDESDSGDSETEGEEDGDKGAGDKGTGSQTHSVPPPPSQPGEVWDATADDGSPLTEGEKDEKMREVVEDLQQAEHIAKQCGLDGSADRRRAVERITRPKMNWRNYLTRWFKDKGTPIGRTWSKPDRRALSQGMILPGPIKEGMEWAVLAIDVSGSIAPPELEAFFSHIELIRKQMKINRMTLLPFNHIALQTEIVELGPNDKIPRSLNIGGGTRFAPIFNWVRRQPKTPDGIIVFTDLCCADYGDPVPTSILWASTMEICHDKDHWRHNAPPFGEAIEIDISDD